MTATVFAAIELHRKKSRVKITNHNVAEVEKEIKLAVKPACISNVTWIW
jgi:hypothetical protein